MRKTRLLKSHAVRSRAANEPAWQELQNFLEAVSSYPEYFANNPRLSFQQHLLGVCAKNSAEQVRRPR